MIKEIKQCGLFVAMAAVIVLPLQAGEYGYYGCERQVAGLERQLNVAKKTNNASNIRRLERAIAAAEKKCNVAKSKKQVGAASGKGKGADANAAPTKKMDPNDPFFEFYLDDLKQNVDRLTKAVAARKAELNKARNAVERADIEKKLKRDEKRLSDAKRELALYDNVKPNKAAPANAGKGAQAQPNKPNSGQNNPQNMQSQGNRGNQVNQNQQNQVRQQTPQNQNQQNQGRAVPNRP